MEFYRIFAAIPLEAAGPVAQAREELMLALRDERISWVKPALMHVTLRFLGDTAVMDLAGIKMAVKGLPVPDDVRYFRTGDPALFGPQKRPRVIYLPLEEEGLCLELRMALDQALWAHGLSPEDQAYRPHLTLGRIRSLRDVEGLRAKLELMKGCFSAALRADRVVLYRSILKKEGPVYVPLEIVPFN